MTRAQFSCFLIGSDTLLMECGNVLLSEGHIVRGVISSERRVADWCAAHGVQFLDARVDYRSILAQEPFDYLFAITHLAIIPDSVLALPAKLAINFHDGPLPRYAGLNTPVWALLNRETTHGISWHVITTGVDAGDLLKQATIDVSPNETALSLNTKCMAAAVETFPELVKELAAGTETRTRQDLTKRSYFGKFKRPAAACAIDWSASAADIEAFVRSLTFGPYPNPVGVAKTYRADAPSAPVIVTAIELAGSIGSSGEPGGTVLDVSDRGVVVATASEPIVITGARSLSGDDLGLEQLVESLGVERGTRLGSPHTATGERLTQTDLELCRHEEYWTDRLAAADPPHLPQALPAAAGPRATWGRTALSVPVSIQGRFGGDAGIAILAGFAVYLARTGRKERFTLSCPAVDTGQTAGWYSRTVPLMVDLDAGWTTAELVASLREERDRVEARKGFLRDLVLRQPLLSSREEFLRHGALPVGFAFAPVGEDEGPPGSLLSLELSSDGRSADLVFDVDRLSVADVDSIGASVSTCLEAMSRDGTSLWRELDLVPRRDRDLQLVEWTRTEVEVEPRKCMHEHFEAQVDRTPDAVAVVFRGNSLTYRELDNRANSLARFLRRRGVGPDALVGVNIDRSVDLLVATLGVLKAGGAYVPLDPEFPSDRISFMIQDSGARILLSQASLAGSLPDTSAEVIELDTRWLEIAREGSERPDRTAGPSNLAYAIYTSGSTGTPKGVLVEHRNVGNFFSGMDRVIDHDPPGVWLAVTSLSFDISVLELFWTLARGFTVVVYKDPHRGAAQVGELRTDPTVAGLPMRFGLFMWGNDDGPTANKYELMLEAAKYFDANGFDSVWTPERHFHAFGGPFPNPSVTGAALAVTTKNLGIRAGSCVAPLHHPIRIAEEWAVVDNLSKGRVGLSFAAGWQPNDFVIRPENFPNNKQVMIDQIDVVRRLWRGEKVEFVNPQGKSVEVATLPRPVQAELPVWMTTAGNPESYRQAGLMGANVLTHLLGQTLEEVAGKIAVYRSARAEAGLDPAAGVVTLMLHTFVGEGDDEVRELVRQPMKDYLAASMKLVLGFAWSFPAFRRPGGAEANVEDVDLSSLTEEEEEAILDFAFDRYFETSGLFGTTETCLRMVERCKGAGVDEIACLLDFGVDTALVLESMPHLKTVRDAANQPAGRLPDASERYSFADQVRRHGVTHLQCTPSMARMVAEDSEGRSALGGIRHLMIGGEAFPPALAADLLDLSSGTVTNMYGPTETTIWSSTHRLETGTGSIPIGRPIANTGMYVLDRHRQPLPLGIPGDLYIGGDGVARGYHRRPELTAERFVADPFRAGEGRMYWTGDLARFRDDGSLDFLGRVDNQVKIRGYRIELGEIEAALERLAEVRVAAVVLREVRTGDQRLVAYVVPSGTTLDAARVRQSLHAVLPEYMVPGQIVALRELPLTPNGKVDRKALPAPPDGSTPVAAKHVEPTGELEGIIASSWCAILGLERVGVEDNFFDVGGHSLLVVQLHRRLREVIKQPVSLVDLYRFPTIRSFTNHLTADSSGGELQQSVERAQKRREALATRRRRNG